MKHNLMLAILLLAIAPLAWSQEPRVLAVKQFSGIYPASASLRIPFHGCVELEGQLPAGDGEYWLALDHLITDDDFDKIQVLVNTDGTILGARASFKGLAEEWRGEHGYASRKRVLEVFLGGDGPELARNLPLAHDGSHFGGMVYTFDESGHVFWRIAQGANVINEAEYVAGQNRHKRACQECKNLNTAAEIILPSKPTSEPVAPPKE
jgi:hypothetical protein